MNLIEAQLNAIYYTWGPALALAVSGVGKATVLMTRLVQFIDLSYPAGKLSAITFSESISLDMKKHFRDPFPQLEGPRFMAIHILCFQIIQQLHPQSKSL